MCLCVLPDYNVHRDAIKVCEQYEIEVKKISDSKECRIV